MELLLIIFMLIISSFLLIFSYYAFYKRYDQMTVLKLTFKAYGQAYRYLIAKYRIYLLRQKTFDRLPYIKTFEETINGQHVCGYFKHKDTWFVNQDVYCLCFEIMKVSSEYKNSLPELGELIRQLYQDQCEEMYGCYAAPRVYLSVIDQSHIDLWVAKNAYGNELIAQRAEADRNKDKPHGEELVDE